MIVSNIELYSDINKRTPLQKSRIINVESIKNSLSNILNIRDKEILFDFSNMNLENFLFELYTEENAFSLTNTVLEAIAKDPRIDADFQNTQASISPDNTSYSINVKYGIKGINASQVTSFKI